MSLSTDKFEPIGISELYNKLGQIIDLPPANNVTRLELILEVGSTPKLSISQYIQRRPKQNELIYEEQDIDEIQYVLQRID